MLAPDVAPSRLQRAKLLAEDLIGDLGADRVGLVAFAGSAFLQAPLTLDHGAVLAALDELDTTVIPKGGTNIAAAIATAEEAFGKAEGFSRALVIISDGEELDADGIKAAKQAGTDGIRIFTVGVGSPEGSEIPLGPGEFVRDPSGKVVQSRLDAARMKEIAEASGGFYTPLDEGAAQRLAADGIGKLAETDITTNSSRRPIERYQWPLGAAIALLVLQALVGERRRRPFAIAAALWFFCMPATWAAPAGLDAYEHGDYERARQAFESRLRMEPGSPDLQLNAGAAAYRLKDYNKASEYFSRAMLAQDPALRSSAEFNLANTLFRQGEGQQDAAKKVTDWKDAITKYDAALKTRPDYTEAKENKQRVEELLKQLEQQQKQQQKKKDQQKQDKQKQDQQQDQQQGGQDKKDQQQSGNQKKEDQQQGDKKDEQQQGGGQQDKKDQQEGQKDQQKQDQQPGGQDKKEQEKSGDQKQDQQQSGGGDQKKEDQQQGDEKDQKEQGGGDKKDEQEQKGGEGEKKDEKSGEKGEEKKPGAGGEGKEKEQGKEGEKKEDSKQGEGQREGGEQQPKPGEGQREEGKQEPKEGGQPSDARQQLGGNQTGEKPAPLPQQSGEKKQGEVRGAQEGGSGGDKKEAAALAEAEAEAEGRMSESQARSLLRSLQNEEEQVQLLERRNFQDVSRDW